MTTTIWCSRCKRQHAVRRPTQAERPSWKRDLREGLLMVPVLLALYLGVPFLLWIVMVGK